MTYAENVFLLKKFKLTKLVIVSVFRPVFGIRIILLFRAVICRSFAGN